MPDMKDERIERGRESLQRMERLIERHSSKSQKPRFPQTRGSNWGAADNAGAVVRGAARTPFASSKDKASRQNRETEGASPAFSVIPIYREPGREAGLIDG